MDLKNIIYKTLTILFLISSVTLISCSGKVCSASSGSEDGAYSRQNIKDSRNADQSIPSPYTDKYRAKLQVNNFGQ